MIVQEPILTATCHFCKVTTPLDNAIETGWTPSFWRTENEEVLEPVCTQCLAQYLRFNEEMGDYEVPSITAKGDER
jgi:hypothetical protein